MRVETLRRSRRGRARHERRRSVPKIQPLPGGLFTERKRCNRPNCHCAAGGDALHGPYLFRRWSENGRLRRQYVKAADADRVRAGLAGGSGCTRPRDRPAITSAISDRSFDPW
jgi:hypothetical protein